MSALVGTEPLSVAVAFLRAEHDRLDAAMTQAYEEADSQEHDLNALSVSEPEHPALAAYDRAVYLGHRASRVKDALQALCEHPDAGPWQPPGALSSVSNVDYQYAHRCPACGKIDWHGPNLRWRSPSEGVAIMREIEARRQG